MSLKEVSQFTREKYEHKIDFYEQNLYKANI